MAIIAILAASIIFLATMLNFIALKLLKFKSQEFAMFASCLIGTGIVFFLARRYFLDVSLSFLKVQLETDASRSLTQLEWSNYVGEIMSNSDIMSLVSIEAAKYTLPVGAVVTIFLLWLVDSRKKRIDNIQNDL